MSSTNMLKRLVNGSVVLKHIFGVLGVLGVVIVAVTLLYADVRATGKEVKRNSESVEAIKESINEMTTKQQLLLQKAADDKDFQKETRKTLNEILLRLPRRERPLR